MKGYDSKEAMAGHRYNMSAKHRRRESEGMKRYEDSRKGSHKRIDTASKHTFGVDTMSEDYDMNRIKKIPQEYRGYSSEAWDYKY